ncbi:MAG: type II methionyl aminopeptidase [Thermoplasmata archaeon]|nr:type II methionyl aminopeptidase [Thermoplasmata archaeon]
MDEETIEKYRQAGKIANEARNFGKKIIKEDVSLLEVVSKIEEMIVKRGARVAFPVNIAIDEVAAHFTPRHDDDKLLFQRGNVVKLDVGAHMDGYIADTAVTVEVSTHNWQDLIKASEEALVIAIDLIKPGVDLGVLGKAVEQTITRFGFKPISNLTGHSLEQYKLHAGLSIPNVGEHNSGEVEEGQVIAIEPFASAGAGKVNGYKMSNIYRFVRERPIVDSNAKLILEKIIKYRKSLPFSERWCTRYLPKPNKALFKLIRAQTISMYPILKDKDGGMVSQSEHSVIVTEDGCEVIT